MVNNQGEENDIILLSLVRSNKEGGNGILGIDNRVCVALSGGRHANFYIGTFSQLLTALLKACFVGKDSKSCVHGLVMAVSCSAAASLV